MSPFLADDLFLITHDASSGKPRLPRAALGVGISGALFAELLLSGSLEVARGDLAVGHRPAAREALTQSLLAEVEQEIWTRRVSLSDALASYFHSAYDLVAERLVRSGLANPAASRRLGRSTVRYLPTQPGEVFMRTQRLSAYVRNRMELTTGDVVLVRLMLALPGGPQLLELGRADRAALNPQVSMLPQAIGALLETIEAAAMPYRAAEGGPP